MVTPALDQTPPPLHPLRVHWTSRAWWTAGQALQWLAAAVVLGVLWVTPQGGLEGVTATVFWGSFAAAAAAVAAGRLSRGAQWQAWAEVPGANATHSLWSRPRFEYTRVPDLLAATLRIAVVAAVGVAIAAQSNGHAYLIGVVGSGAALLGLFYAAREVAASKVSGFPVNWVSAAREGTMLFPGVAWCAVGDPTAVALGSQIGATMLVMYVLWKVSVHLMRPAGSRGATS